MSRSGTVLLFAGYRQLVELLWQVIGREELEIDSEGVQLRHVVFGRGTSRRYATDAVSSVFVSHTNEPHPWVAWSAPGTLFSRRRFGPPAFEFFTRGRVAVRMTGAARPLAGARRGGDDSSTVSRLQATAARPGLKSSPPCTGGMI